MTVLKERICDLVNNHPLAPLHAEQIYCLLQENGDDVTQEEVDKECDSIEGADLLPCREIKCFFPQA